MKISAAEWCYWRDGQDASLYYATLSAIGVDAVEMTPPDRWPAARDAGLALLNLAGPGMQKGLNCLENHAELVPQIESLIATAAGDGIGHVIVFSGNRDGQDDATGRSNCAKALDRLLGPAEAAGVTLVFEMLNSFDHADYQADRGRYGFQLVRDLGSPNLRVLYDVYHLARMGEDVLADALDNLDLVAHFHLADIPARTLPAADARIDYRALVSRVHAAGYRGYWGMEFCPRAQPLAELAAAVELFRSYVQP